MTMLLITEEIQDIQFLTEEDEKGQKQQYIKGIFMQAEQLNRNGRWYPLPVLSREADRYNSEYVKKNRAFGELGHPENPQINLDRVSHMITSLERDGNNFVGKAKILDTPNGKIVKSLLSGGASLGVSTRGVGSLKPCNGYQQVRPLPLSKELWKAKNGYSRMETSRKSTSKTLEEPSRKRRKTKLKVSP
jgi:hypothetical protein